MALTDNYAGLECPKAGCVLQRSRMTVASIYNVDESTRDINSEEGGTGDVKGKQNGFVLHTLKNKVQNLESTSKAILIQTQCNIAIFKVYFACDSHSHTVRYHARCIAASTPHVQAKGTLRVLSWVWIYRSKYGAVDQPESRSLSSSAG